MCGRNKVYVFRQSFILFTILLQSLSNGAMLGFPSVLNAAILDPDTTDIKATPSQASWIASVLGFAGIIGYFILSPIMQILGRKAAHFAKNIIITIGWIVLYYATSISGIFAARIIQGTSIGAIFINVMIIGEYAAPRRRGYFITIQKFALSFGTLMCHTLALCCTWRQISAIFTIPPALAILFTFYWAESPYFLAFKGDFEKCEESFHWLNGRTKRNKELQDLIADQRIRLETIKNYNRNKLQNLFNDLGRRDYQKSIFIVAILIVVVDLSGRNFFKAYVVQIMSELIANKSVAMYLSILGDFTTLIALFLSCFIIRYVRRKLLILSFVILSISIMYCLGIILLIRSKFNWVGLPWLTPFLVLLLNFIVHVGVSPVCFVIIGEIFPLDLKGIGSFSSGIVFTISYGVIIKLTPVIMENLGLGSLYAIYGTCLLFCLIPLYFILPETKDQTLLEIEEKIKGHDKSEVILLERSTITQVD